MPCPVNNDPSLEVRVEEAFAARADALQRRLRGLRKALAANAEDEAEFIALDGIVDELRAVVRTAADARVGHQPVEALTSLLDALDVDAGIS